MYFICKAYPVILLMLQRKLRFGMKVVSGFKYFIYCQSVRWQVRRLNAIYENFGIKFSLVNTLVFFREYLQEKKTKKASFSFRKLLFCNSEFNASSRNPIAPHAKFSTLTSQFCFIYNCKSSGHLQISHYDFETCAWNARPLQRDELNWSSVNPFAFHYGGNWLHNKHLYYSNPQFVYLELFNCF